MSEWVSVCSVVTLLPVCVCVCVCSAERHGLLLGLFQEWIPGGLQELLNEMEGSGQEWWEGRRGGRLLGAVGGLSGSHLQAWLNNRMLYENRDIICLFKGRERPSNWLPLSLCVLPPVSERRAPLPCRDHKLKEMSPGHFLSSCRSTLITPTGMYQHTDTKLTEKACFSLLLGGGLFSHESLDQVWYKQ